MGRSREKELNGIELKQPQVALVYECFEMSVNDFQREWWLELAAVRHILRTLVSALHYMHDHGLLHADLKPSNILRKYNTQLGGLEIKIADFGAFNLLGKTTYTAQ